MREHVKEKPQVSDLNEAEAPFMKEVQGGPLRASVAVPDSGSQVSPAHGPPTTKGCTLPSGPVGSRALATAVQAAWRREHRRRCPSAPLGASPALPAPCSCHSTADEAGEQPRRVLG